MPKSRELLLAGASALAILAGAAEANAATVVFNFTGGLQTFIAPVVGIYEIDAPPLTSDTSPLTSAPRPPEAAAVAGAALFWRT
jgi:hypothetical protein